MLSSGPKVSIHNVKSLSSVYSQTTKDPSIDSKLYFVPNITPLLWLGIYVTHRHSSLSSLPDLTSESFHCLFFFCLNSGVSFSRSPVPEEGIGPLGGEASPRWGNGNLTLESWNLTAFCLHLPTAISSAFRVQMEEGSSAQCLGPVSRQHCVAVPTLVRSRYLWYTLCW